MERQSTLRTGQALWLKITTAAVMLFLYLPVIILVVYSFNSSRYGTRWESFSFKWYGILFRDESLWHAVLNSLIIAFSSSTVSVVIGTVAALYLHRNSSRIRNILHTFMHLPMIIPDIVIAVAMLLFFVMIHFTLGILSITIAHITFSFTYVTLVVLTRLASFDSRLEEASMDLGATPRQTFINITLPNISPALLAGFLLAFMMSIDDFIVTFFTSGVGSTTLPLKIYSMIKFSITPEINAVSTLLLIFTVTLLLIIRTVQNRGHIRNQQKEHINISPKEGLL